MHFGNKTYFISTKISFKRYISKLDAGLLMYSFYLNNACVFTETDVKALT